MSYAHRWRTIEKYAVGRNVFKIQEKLGPDFPAYRVYRNWNSGNQAIGEFIVEAGSIETPGGARLEILLWLDRETKAGFGFGFYADGTGLKRKRNSK